jgi:hypothetical protein
LAKASSGIFNNPGEPASKAYLDVSFDNVGLEGTEKFILQSSGEILDKIIKYITARLCQCQ